MSAMPRRLSLRDERRQVMADNDLLRNALRPVSVEVYSSFAYAVEPCAFIDRDVRHAVQAIERMWKTPGRTHFYVRDESQHWFELIYEEAQDSWWLRTFGETCPIPSKA